MNSPEPKKLSDHDSPGCLMSFITFVCGAFGGFITFIFAFFLVMVICSRLVGGPPGPVNIQGFLFWLVLGAGPLGVNKLLSATPAQAQAPRKLSGYSRFVLGMTLAFIALGADSQFGPRSWHALFRPEKAPANLAENLKATYVTPHLEISLTPGTNLLWCGTFQLVWDAACTLSGADLHLEKDSPMVSALNKHAFGANSLDPASYVATAGTVKENICEKIRGELNQKFGNAFKPHAIPDTAVTSGQNDLVIYACLFKHLNFPVPFERLDETLAFGGTKVRAFGMGPYKPTHIDMYPQVLIYDYQGEDDFAVELKTTSGGDRVILAKIKPQASFTDTVANVRHRIANNKGSVAVNQDVLIIPRVNFDLTRHYTELENHPLFAGSAGATSNNRLISALQQTRFEMNEKGVELQSEAHIVIGCAKESPPEIKHRMIFNKPFLVLLERADAPMPYFALWIDNTELLVPW